MRYVYSILWLLGILFFGLLFSPVGLIALALYLLALKNTSLRPTCKAVALFYDKLIAYCIDVHNSSTLSEQTGYLSHYGFTPAIYVEYVIDFIIEILTGQKHHCYFSVDWSKYRKTKNNNK